MGIIIWGRLSELSDQVGYGVFVDRDGEHFQAYIVASHEVVALVRAGSGRLSVVSPLERCWLK